MKSLLLFGLAATVFCVANATGGTKQKENRTPTRLAIHHADPWAVKSLIEGGSLTQPELSTLWGIGGGQGRSQTGNQNAKSPLLEDGFLVVNPTDNSLWWYPKK